MSLKKLTAYAVALPFAVASMAAQAAPASLQAAAVERSASPGLSEAEELRGASPIVVVVVIAAILGAIIALTSNGNSQSN